MTANLGQEGLKKGTQTASIKLPSQATLLQKIVVRKNMI